MGETPVDEDNLPEDIQEQLFEWNTKNETLYNVMMNNKLLFDTLLANKELFDISNLLAFILFLDIFILTIKYGRYFGF